jgi:hypothetical protein
MGCPPECGAVLQTGNAAQDHSLIGVGQARPWAGEICRRSWHKHYHSRRTESAEYYHVSHLLTSHDMEEKARLTILIDPAKKKAFEELCSSQDMTSSQMVRQLIRQYLEKHGVNWLPADKRKLRAKA